MCFYIYYNCIVPRILNSPWIYEFSLGLIFSLWIYEWYHWLQRNHPNETDIFLWRHMSILRLWKTIIIIKKKVQNHWKKKKKKRSESLKGNLGTTELISMLLQASIIEITFFLNQFCNILCAVQLFIPIIAIRKIL